MKTISFDTETYLISKEKPSPPIVCGSFCDGESVAILGGDEAGKDQLYDHVCSWLDEGHRIVCHNAAFDMTVLITAWPELMESVFDHYSKGLVECTVIREKLIDIARGNLSPNKGFYSLAHLVKNYKLGSFSSDEKGEDAWRMRYSELDGIPIEDWPKDAVDYPLKDAGLTWSLYHHQTPRGEKYGALSDCRFQAMADFALRLTSLRGLYTDSERVFELRKELEQKIEEAAEQAIELGLMERGLKIVKDEDGKSVKKEVPKANGKGMKLVCVKESCLKKKNKVLQDRVVSHMKSLGKLPKKTDKGGIAIDADTLRDYVGKVPGVEEWLAYVKNEKQMSTYIPTLERGIDHPVRPQFDVLKETGRTSSYSPNIQQMPRKGGIRECFRAREGYVFINSDYDAQELRCLAQVWMSLFGKSRMARFFQRDPNFDPHSLFASEAFLKCTYEEALQRVADKDEEALDARQRAKIANFGYPGGLGPATLVEYARGFGYYLTEQESVQLKNSWLNTWPEANQYFLWANKQIDIHDGTAIQLGSKRKRGKCSYCQLLNTMFQGLAGDITKWALWNVMLERVKSPDSPLGLSHPVTYIHDEIGIEAPEDCAEEAAQQLVAIMERCQEDLTPDVPARAGFKIGKHWEK